MVDACATCATPYNDPLAPASEKPLFPGRDLPCCSRTICFRCLNQNKRYETYCPYCQITTEPSLLPQGLRDPPGYETGEKGAESSRRGGEDEDEELPAYSEHHFVNAPAEKGSEEEQSPDVLHFVTPNDSMRSLALGYGVPIDALRKANNVYSDHLVQARRTVIIPGEHYKGGVSLSPRPIEGEEEEARRAKVRRWMVACKVVEYDVALLYLQQADWDLEIATEAYREDERWEKEHPMEAKERAKKGKGAKNVGMRRFVGGA